jgi:hypothetical protein
MPSSRNFPTVNLGADVTSTYPEEPIRNAFFGTKSCGWAQMPFSPACSGHNLRLAQKVAAGHWLFQLCGERIATIVGRTWGLGLGKRPGKDRVPEKASSEMCGSLRQSADYGFTADIWHTRPYSRFLALQLAARYLGVDPHVYGTPTPTLPTGENREI